MRFGATTDAEAQSLSGTCAGAPSDTHSDAAHRWHERVVTDSSIGFDFGAKRSHHWTHREVSLKGGYVSESGGFGAVARCDGISGSAREALVVVHQVAG
jgi:hypothetical protein